MKLVKNLSTGKSSTGKRLQTYQLVERLYLDGPWEADTIPG